MADKRAGEIKRLFKDLGFDVRSDPTNRYATSERKGRSDLVLSLHGRSVFCEVKNGSDRWTTKDADPKKGWTQQQRDYGLWAERNDIAPYYVALMVGTKPANYDHAKYMAKRFWLIPFFAAINVVEKAEFHANFIPYLAHQGMRPKAFIGMGMSCVQQFLDYEIPYVMGEGGGKWVIPPRHPFYQYL